MHEQTFRAYIEVDGSDKCRHCGIHWEPGSTGMGRSPDAELLAELGDPFYGLVEFDVVRCRSCNAIHLAIYRPLLKVVWDHDLVIPITWKYKTQEGGTQHGGVHLSGVH